MSLDVQIVKLPSERPKAFKSAIRCRWTTTNEWLTIQATDFFKEVSQATNSQATPSAALSDHARWLAECMGGLRIKFSPTFLFEGFSISWCPTQELYSAAQAAAQWHRQVVQEAHRHNPPQLPPSWLRVNGHDFPRVAPGHNPEGGITVSVLTEHLPEVSITLHLHAKDPSTHEQEILQIAQRLREHAQ